MGDSLYNSSLNAILSSGLPKEKRAGVWKRPGLLLQVVLFLKLSHLKASKISIFPYSSSFYHRVLG